MRRAVETVMTACACLVCAPVQAQIYDDPPIGSRLGKRKTIEVPHSAKESATAAHRLAGCVYVKAPTAVRSMLAAPNVEEGKKRAASLDYKGTCINLLPIADDTYAQESSLPYDIYRGMLAEAAVRQGNLGKSLAPLPRGTVYAAPWFAATGRPTAVDEMGACVADTNPTGILSLLSTTAETADEKKAVGVLAPSLGPCLSAGATLNANRQSLRAALAEALYQRAVARLAPVAVQ